MENDGRSKLEQLKEAYHTIPVPASARESMMAGIEKAKKEKRRRNVIQFTKKTGLTAAAALFAITVMANVSPVTANAMENIPVIGTIAKVVTFRTFEDTKIIMRQRLTSRRYRSEISPVRRSTSRSRSMQTS